MRDGTTAVLSRGSHRLTAELPDDGGSRNVRDLATAIG